MVRECAKPWAEADADVCEAIDFLEYYARAAIELERGPELLQAPGERNSMRYAPRGVVAVIAPWNFPLAIPTGMTAAGAGGRQRRGAQARRAVARLRAGAGRGAARRGRPARTRWPCSRASATPAPRWCAHPGVHVIAFTGSGGGGPGDRQRGRARPRTARRHVKRVVAEMGGKNCVIVDSDADLDEAVPAIVDSAFGYAGQKCSAAARVLAHEAVHDALVERLAGAVEVLAVGQAERLRHRGAAGDRRGGPRPRARLCATRPSARARIAARAEARRARAGSARPLLAAGLDPDAQVLREEVFGPLLTVEAVESVEEACDVVDSLPFALTGGLFSRSPATVCRGVAPLARSATST